MADRELLEMAAKAAGIAGTYDSWCYQGFNEGIRRDTEYRPWNPLTDDGDALRLAVKLHLTCRFYFGDYVAQSTVPGGPAVYVTDRDYRRAIVRAAAEIAEAMERLNHGK